MVEKLASLPSASFAAAVVGVVVAAAKVIGSVHSKRSGLASIVGHYVMAIGLRHSMDATNDSVSEPLEIGSFAMAIGDAEFAGCGAYEAVVNADRANRFHWHWLHTSLSQLVQAHSATALYVMDVVQSAFAAAVGGDEMHSSFGAAMGMCCLEYGSIFV